MTYDLLARVTTDPPCETRQLFRSILPCFKKEAATEQKRDTLEASFELFV
jgi:hypothetical protein